MTSLLDPVKFVLAPLSSRIIIAFAKQKMTGIWDLEKCPEVPRFQLCAGSDWLSGYPKVRCTWSCSVRVTTNGSLQKKTSTDAGGPTDAGAADTGRSGEKKIGICRVEYL